MVVSINSEPEYRLPDTLSLITGTPQKVPLIFFGNPQILIKLFSNPYSKLGGDGDQQCKCWRPAVASPRLCLWYLAAVRTCCWHLLNCTSPLAPQAPSGPWHVLLSSHMAKVACNSLLGALLRGSATQGVLGLAEDLRLRRSTAKRASSQLIRCLSQ